MVLVWGWDGKSDTNEHGCEALSLYLLINFELFMLFRELLMLIQKGRVFNSFLR